jgi:hypothetical protein
MLVTQRAGGGWSGRTQHKVARPEVTAWVLVAATRLGLDPVRRTELVARLEQLLDPTIDPTGMRHTTVLTSALSALAEVGPQSPRLVELATSLSRAATLTKGGPLRQAAWGEVIRPGAPPSVPHTARVVVALQLARDALPVGGGTAVPGLREMIESGIEWLCQNADLDLADERLRRGEQDERDDTDVDQLLIQHFTPAWVARALMIAGRADDPRQVDLLRQCVRDVVRAQRHGVWRWRNKDQEPLWMTYQGALVLRDYAWRNMPWPP